MSDTQEQTKAIQPSEKVPVRFGLMPSTIDEGWRLAVIFGKSELAPPAFRGKPEDILVAMQMGAELGFTPMQALQSIAVVNGRPSVWGDGLLALVMSSPLYVDHAEHFDVGGQIRQLLTAEDLKLETTAAICTFWRRDKATPVQRMFSVGQAKRAGLLQKPGTWQTYPDRMLLMRARSFAARDAFPDLLRGIKSAEEVQDLPAPDRPAPYIVRRASDVVDAPAPATVQEDVIGPVTIQSVAVEHQDCGNGEVRLSDGHVVIAEQEDLTELQKFVGTAHRLQLTVTKHPTDGKDYVQAFELVD